MIPNTGISTYVVMDAGIKKTRSSQMCSMFFSLPGCFDCFTVGHKTITLQCHKNIQSKSDLIQFCTVLSYLSLKRLFWLLYPILYVVVFSFNSRLCLSLKIVNTLEENVNKYWALQNIVKGLENSEIFKIFFIARPYRTNSSLLSWEWATIINMHMHAAGLDELHSPTSHFLNSLRRQQTDCQMTTRFIFQLHF